MNPALTDDVWKRRGISILWDGDTLAQFQSTAKVISLRRFFELYEADWPEDDIPFINNDAVMVAGLDVMLDTLEPDEAVDWVEQQVYSKIQSFQSCFENNCALIFWMADKNRWKENAGENSYEWWLSGKYKEHTFPIGRCIWNGAQNGVRRIESQHGLGAKLRLQSAFSGVGEGCKICPPWPEVRHRGEGMVTPIRRPPRADSGTTGLESGRFSPVARVSPATRPEPAPEFSELRRSRSARQSKIFAGLLVEDEALSQGVIELSIKNHSDDVA